MTTQIEGCRPRPTSDRADEPYGSWVGRAGCAGQSAVFGDPSRSREALVTCAACPALRQVPPLGAPQRRRRCGRRHDPAERTSWRREHGEPEPVVSVEDFLRTEVVSADRTWGRGRSDAILNAVARWTDDGHTAREIGLRLGVTRRTVNRLRATCRERRLIA